MMVNERRKDTDIQASAMITVDEDTAKKYERLDI